MNDRAGMNDEIQTQIGYSKAKKENMGLRGLVVAELFGPDGKLKQRVETDNLVTDVGDVYFSSRAYTNYDTTTGFKLGTATTAASKSGAGSFIATADYVSGSAKAPDESSPKAGATANIVQVIRTWAAGEGTNSTINRVMWGDNTTDAGEADATHTWATAVFAGQIVKGAADTLKVTWNITFLGA